MRLVLLILIAALAGCATSGADHRRTYNLNCGDQVIELGLCNGYQSPHSIP